ncbi:hypothetical protein GPEL0_01f4495 [Geoanaerobacter pelophilus]|uniref:Uncharacterized protein n=1 Tax=Geoanaerobacter pelophilus TaxID=60036 RepID=A0ABQ0MME3_9BACT|nr:hypothetical protein GPEL0_01f4495 [Geoanaerobacter pelophilus]
MEMKLKRPLFSCCGNGDVLRREVGASKEYKKKGAVMLMTAPFLFN